MKLPDQYIPENKKDAKFHLDTVNAILSIQEGNIRYRNERIKEHDNYLIAAGHFDSKQFEYVTDAYGMTTPARLVNYPMISPKLEQLVGELTSQPFQYTVDLINKNGISRKLNKRNQIAAEVILRPIRREIEKATGVPFQDEDLGEEVPDDVETFMNMNYRDNVEKMIHAGMDYVIDKYDFKNTFKRGFYDMLISAKEFYKVYVRNGDPQIKRLHPSSMIYDVHTDKESLQDSKYAGDENYLTVNEIIEMYNPDDKMIEYLNQLENQDAAWYTDMNSNFRNYIYDQKRGLKIRVVEVEWLSQKRMRYKVSENKFDPSTPYYKMLPPDYKPKKDEKIVTKPMNEVRYAIKVGHEKLLAWGVRPNQVRYENNYANTKLSYFGVIKSLNGMTISVVDALKNLQMLYNITMYHIEVTMQRAGGRSVVYDVSQKPENMNLEDVIYHAKNSGMIWINSKQEGGQLNTYNQWSNIDLTLSNQFSQLFNLKMMIEDTADKLTGINPARSGTTKSGDLVGVTQQSIIQSSFITAPLYELHYKVVSDVLNDVANKFRLCWVGQDKMIPILGDLYYELLKIDDSISYDEYGIRVKNSSKEAQKHREMLGLLNQFAASGSVDPLSVIKGVNADSAVEIEGILTKSLKALQASQIAMEQQKMELQKQKNEIDVQKMQVPIQVANITKEKDITVAQINAGAKMEQLSKQHDHEANLNDADRKTQLDVEFLKSSAPKNKDQAEVKPAKTNNNNKEKKK